MNIRYPIYEGVYRILTFHLLMIDYYIVFIFPFLIDSFLSCVHAFLPSILLCSHWERLFSCFHSFLKSCYPDVLKSCRQPFFLSGFKGCFLSFNPAFNLEICYK